MLYYIILYLYSITSGVRDVLEYAVDRTAARIRRFYDSNIIITPLVPQHRTVTTGRVSVTPADHNR